MVVRKWKMVKSEEKEGKSMAFPWLNTGMQWNSNNEATHEGGTICRHARPKISWKGEVSCQNGVGPRITWGKENKSNVVRRGLCFYILVEELLVGVIST